MATTPSPPLPSAVDLHRALPSVISIKTSARPSSSAASPSHRAMRHPVPRTPHPLPLPESSVSPQNSHPSQPHSASHLISHPARIPSPNYFGLAVEPIGQTGSAVMRENRSSPSILAFAAALPQQTHLDSNPDFEKFRRLNDGSHTRGDTRGSVLPSSRLVLSPDQGLASAPRCFDKPLYSKLLPGGPSAPGLTRRPSSSSQLATDTDMSSDRGCSSDLSHKASKGAAGSVSLEHNCETESYPQRTMLTNFEDRDPRLSVMLNRLEAPSPGPAQPPRSDSVPAQDNASPILMAPPSLANLLADEQAHSRLLLLDLRSLQHYARSRIRGALNLCIPTTLLKRATFNLLKLQQTFQNSDDRDAFARWRNAAFLVVYDSHTSEKRDVVTAANMIKKFTAEGYSGHAFILRGGFNLFRDSYPAFVEEAAVSSDPSSASSPSEHPDRALAVGGVSLPSSSQIEPFFSSIRQNVELAAGVGQLDIWRPPGLDLTTLPRWLHQACATGDLGDLVAKKFLRIEVDELARMRSAYAAVSNDPTSQSSLKVRICGFENGVKNRYKDILPFDHARVKLQEKAESTSDYVNASYIKTSRSYKRYIATQGPMPATFNDFWTVIWEHDIRVIVMLTAEAEGGQLKCHSYWKAREYGLIRLKLLTEKKVSLDMDTRWPESSSASSPLVEAGRRRASTVTLLDTTAPAPRPSNGHADSFVTIRKFALSHSAQPFAPMREITQLHYSSWPDFGAPARPSSLLGLIELANLTQRSAPAADSASMTIQRRVSSGTALTSISSITNALNVVSFLHDEPEKEPEARPMLVHCSAGCGRTGTFCTIDSVIDMFKRQRTTARNPINPPVDGQDVAMATSPEPAARHPPYPSPTSGLAWLQDDSVDLIEKTVQELREQRLSMVQSLRQFVLCYETVLEWLWRAQNWQSSHASPGADAAPAATSPLGRSRARSGSLQARHDG